MPDAEHILNSALKERKRIHLIGICGVSMSALAGTLLAKGANVSGSDRSEQPVADELRRSGAEVSIGHKAENVEGAAAVINTAAVHGDNPEIIRAHELGIPVFTRAEAWGALMRHYDNVLCIAGTHGKTTTTSMAVCAAIEAGLDPAAMIGGVLPRIGGTWRAGDSRLFIAESCEYCNSYHSFSPTVAVLLNIDRDHLDFFPSMEAIVDSFRTFALRTPPDGVVIANRDDENVMRAVAGIDRRVITFGLNSTADVCPASPVLKRGFYSFDINIGGEHYASVSLAVPGLHNVYNSLACAAAMSLLGVPGDRFARGIESFGGAGRRFERLGIYHGAVVADDYAHHPNEIAATLKTARTMGFDRVICVFQPHTYTRTVALFDDFVSSLSLADLPVLAEIFAARETNETGISSKSIAERLKNGRFFPSFEEIADYLKGELKSGDLLITMGAGNVNEVAQMLLSKPE